VKQVNIGGNWGEVGMPVVFISYSHDSEAHRDRVLALAQRLRIDGIDVRLDRYVNGGPAEGWPKWMRRRLKEAEYVLLVCSESYYRRFHGDEKVGKGKGATREGAMIDLDLYEERGETLKYVAVLLAQTDEAFIPDPLRGHTHYLLTSEINYQALKTFLAGRAGVTPAPLGKLEVAPGRTVVPLSFPSESSDQKIAPSRLPRGATRLFGREPDLERLEEAWRDPAVHVLTVVAWGGVGKTSLLVKWISDQAARDFDGADYFDWSFYSQGTKDHSTASGDIFIQAALRFFGDPAMADSPASAWDKGARLAVLVASRKTLLVLDGLEPLQHGEESPLEGRLKDQGVTALLKGLALRNSGLCVVTSREKVADLEGWDAAQQWSLDRLPPEAGLDLLRSQGVQGLLADLQKLVADVRGHALTLQLLGSYIRDAHDGDVRRRDLVEIDEADAESRNGLAFRVMEAYERYFEAEGEKGWRQLAVLRLLGLFDRVASAECLKALRVPPAIDGLTEPIAALSDALWRISLRYLADRGLMVLENDGSVDAHPLIREYFADQLRERNLEAWRRAHGRIFDFLKDTTPQFPDSLPGLQPLYQAVFHGCQADRHEEARAAVYRDRILRGSEFYSTRKLGAFGADLAAVACFFEKPWSKLDASLSEADQAWLLNQAAFRLRALGRLREAVEPVGTAVRWAESREMWTEAAIGASSLSELKLTLGEVKAAVADAEQAVIFADRSGDAFQQVARRATLAGAWHQAGDGETALSLFREAEHLQGRFQPKYPLLYSFGGVPVLVESRR
jgi:hypothetical protein